MCCELYLWGLREGLALDRQLAVYVVLIPLLLMALSIPVLSWLYRGFALRVVAAFFDKTFRVACPAAFQNMPEGLDRPPRGAGGA